MERMKTVNLTSGECQEIRYALENRKEWQGMYDNDNYPEYDA